MPQPLTKPRSKAINSTADAHSIAPEMGQNFPETGSKSDLDEIDGQFQQAGLVRHRREKGAGLPAGQVL